MGQQDGLTFQRLEGLFHVSWCTLLPRQWPQNGERAQHGALSRPSLVMRQVSKYLIKHACAHVARPRGSRGTAAGGPVRRKARAPNKSTDNTLVGLRIDTHTAPRPASATASSRRGEGPSRRTGVRRPRAERGLVLPEYRVCISFIKRQYARPTNPLAWR